MLKSRSAEQLLNSFEDKPIDKYAAPMDAINRLTEQVGALVAITKLTEQVGNLSQTLATQAETTSLQIMQQADNTREILLANQTKQVNLEAIIHRDSSNKMTGISIKVKRSYE